VSEQDDRWGPNRQEPPSEHGDYDKLLRGRLSLYQPPRGPRVSHDALFLADFAAGGRPRRILDLGCGCGVVGLVLALRHPGAEIVGVEIQPELAALARRNAELNAAKMSVVEGDVRRPLSLPLPAAGFDLVVSNPPFHRGGQTARDPERALARQELAVSIGEVVTAAARFASDTGKIALVFPAERAPDLLAALAGAEIRPRVLRPVVSVAGEPAARVLVAAQKGYRGGLELFWPLVVHQADRKTYTEEAARILG
jgi:tRNA1Val (adenine37-N6)-methyltransferase